MKLPDEIEKQIEEKVKNIKLTDLKEYAVNLSNRYMNEKRSGQSLLSEDVEAIVYSIIRMPATYSAVKMAALEAKCDEKKIDSILDVGAGTGAASFAISEIIDIKKVTCIERENAMQKLGKELMHEHSVLKNAEWIDLDIEKDEMNKKADLVVSSYMLNEIREENRIAVVEKLLKATNKILIIIEPGTPAGFNNIRKIQKYAIDNNIKILAPCTGQTYCKLNSDDWCHSIVRVERNKLHKYLKDGDAPYEDEKFSYIALSKIVDSNEDSISKARILRHPLIEKGKITLKVCLNGEISSIIITKKDKELFKMAKKKSCGECILYIKEEF